MRRLHTICITIISVVVIVDVITYDHRLGTRVKNSVIYDKKHLPIYEYLQ